MNNLSKEETASPLHFLCRAAGVAAVQPDSNSEVQSQALAAGVPYIELYEVLLQTYLFAGFPAAIEALSTLKHVSTEEPPEYEPFLVDTFKERGEKLCSEIYGSAYPKIREVFGQVTPDLDMWMIVEGYGKTLSRPALSPLKRELAIIATLFSTGRKRQLFSHTRGAIFLGATRHEISTACQAVADLLPPEKVEAANEVVGSAVEKYLL